MKLFIYSKHAVLWTSMWKKSVIFIITVLGENRNQPPDPHPCLETSPSKNDLD